MKQSPVSVSSEPESGPRVLRCCGTLVASLVVRTPGLIMMPGPGTGETESGSGHAGTKAVFVGLLPSSCGSSASLWCRARKHATRDHDEVGTRPSIGEEGS